MNDHYTIINLSLISLKAKNGVPHQWELIYKRTSLNVAEYFKYVLQTCQRKILSS